MTEPIIIRTSDRGQFKRCRVLWDFTSKMRLNFEYSPGIEPLDFGIAIHAGAEVYWDPDLFDGPIEVREQLAIVAFMEHMTDWRKRIKEADMWDAMQEKWEEHREMGIGMLNHYFLWAPNAFKGWRPVKSEIEFEVPIPLTGPQDRFPYNNGFHCEYVDGIGYLHYQKKPVVYQGRIDLILQNEETGELWILDHKAQPLTERILTPTGWVSMGSVREGDEVIGSNGQPTKVLGVYPQGELEEWSVTFDDGTRVLCSRDHWWTVQRGTIQAHELRYGDRVQLAQPVQFHQTDGDLPLHPYLLGLWLGDGSSNKSMVLYSSKSGETIDIASKYLPEGHTFKKNSERNYSWTLSAEKRTNQFSDETNLVRQALRWFGLWGKRSRTKFVPDIYLTASIAERLLLLQGLMDADGTVSGGIPRFCTTNRELASAVEELVLSLGGKVKTSWPNRQSTNKGIKVNFRLPEGMNPFQVAYKRNAVVVPKKGFYRRVQHVECTGRSVPMQCISVEAQDGLYVTRNYVLTHNTAAQFGQTEHLELDQQCGSYVWALKKLLNIDIAGVIYSEWRKKVPKEPDMLKSGLPSKNKSQSTTPELYRKKLEELGLDTEMYADFLQTLQDEGQQYFRNIPIHRSSQELAALEANIVNEAIDMIDNPRIYPNPSRWNCNGCQFRSPCLMRQEGSDHIWYLDSSKLYRKRGGTN